MPGGSGRLLQYSSTLTRSAFKNTHRSFKLCLGSEPLTLPPLQRTCGGEYTGLQPKLDDSLNRISEICTSTTLVVFTDIFSVSFFGCFWKFYFFSKRVSFYYFPLLLAAVTQNVLLLFYAYYLYLFHIIVKHFILIGQ